jgi:hypothetical protein
LETGRKTKEGEREENGKKEEQIEPEFVKLTLRSQESIARYVIQSPNF